MTTPYWSDFVPNSTFYRILSGFHRTFATGVACRQEMLTPPDTWSRPFWTCICSTCWDQSFSKLVVIFLRTLLGLWYFLHFALYVIFYFVSLFTSYCVFLTIDFSHFRMPCIPDYSTSLVLGLWQYRVFVLILLQKLITETWMILLHLRRIKQFINLVVTKARNCDIWFFYSLARR